MSNQYDIKPPENDLERMLKKPKNERGTGILEQKLAKKGALGSNKLDSLQNNKLQANEQQQSLSDMLGVENSTNDSNKKRKHKKRKRKRFLLPFHRKKGPIRKLGKKARHTAMFLGIFAFPIALLIMSIGMFLFIGAALNYAHQVEVISTLASPQYYAEMGARGILGGARKITDIPQDLIGAEPDLNVDYSHNGAMNKHDGLSNKIGSVGGKNGLELRKSIARAVAKYIGSKHPELIFAQMWAEHSGYKIDSLAAKDKNLSGIKFAHQEGATPGITSSEGDPYAHFKSWKYYAKCYAKTLKNGYPGVAKANTPAEYAHALKHGKFGAYYGAPESQYATNMSAGVKAYKSAGGNKGAPITNQGSKQTIMYGNGTKTVDPSDVTTSTGSLNDTNPHRQKRLLYFYSKRFANKNGAGGGGSEVIKGGGLSKLMKIVRSLLHIPYVWGGAHGDLHSYKKGMDCSGLINVIWWKAGLGEHHLNTIGWEDQCSQYVSKSDLQPGDLLFWGGHNSSHHVALYLGHNKYVQEPEPGQSCEIRPLSWNPYSFAKRNKAMHNYVRKHAIIKKKGSGGGRSSGKYNPTAGEKWIIAHESGGNPHAQNPSPAMGTSEHAYGIGQLLPSWYKKYTPGQNWKNSKAVQLKAMRKYIKERYGSTKAALAHWHSAGWY